jgi:predicted secreted protein
MAILAGNNGRVLVTQTGGSGLTALAAVRSFSIDMTADTIESTTMGNDTRQYLKGLSTWSGTADIYFDPAEFPTDGLSTQLGVLNPTITTGTGIKRVGGTGVVGEFYLGSTGGTDNNTANKFSGTIIVTGFTVNSSMDGMVEASISFQGSGACTFSAT